MSSTDLAAQPNYFHIITLVQATSCEVERAHRVAAAITRFCNMVSSATWATFLAFRTNMAAALATALAKFIRVSCKARTNVLIKAGVKKNCFRALLDPIYLTEYDIQIAHCTDVQEKANYPIIYILLYDTVNSKEWKAEDNNVLKCLGYC